MNELTLAILQAEKACYERVLRQLAKSETALGVLETQKYEFHLRRVCGEIASLRESTTK